MTYPFVLALISGALLIGSCGNQPTLPGKDEVCIKLKKDTSELGRRNHFIPVMSIDVFKKDFDSTRVKLVKHFPELAIPTSETFNRASLVEFLKDSTVVGLKFYYGLKPSSDKTKSLRLIIVGVDSLGHDVYIKKGSRFAAQSTDDKGGLEYGQCEPPCTN
jgi:hypothetical protein